MLQIRTKHLNMEVTIYTTPICQFSDMAKKFLEERGVSYTEHDVSRDLERRREMIDKSNQMGVPVILIDEEIVVGFDRSRLEDLLA